MRWIYLALYNALSLKRSDVACVTRGSHSFTCHPHTNHTCRFSPAARLCRPSVLRLPMKGWPGWLHTVVAYIFYLHILQREICTHFCLFCFPRNTSIVTLLCMCKVWARTWMEQCLVCMLVATQLHAYIGPVKENFSSVGLCSRREVSQT